jgi:hypothetical protein
MNFGTAACGILSVSALIANRENSLPELLHRKSKNRLNDPRAH